MFRLVCLISTLIGFAASVPTNQCTVGSWSAWSQCQPTKRCVPKEEAESLLQTYSMEASDAWDTGRMKMQLLMAMKEKRATEHAECVARGECLSSMADRPSSGPTQCVNGLAGDIPCSNVDQLYFMNFADQGYVPIPSDNSPAGNDVWGWTDPLNGDEYAILGLTGATTFVRITDPTKPVALGVLYSATTAAVWRDMKVIGHYAYIVSEARNHGLQVFDLTRLRGKTEREVYTADAVYTGFGNAHNIVANEDTNFVYVVGATQAGYPLSCRGGLFVLDVSNPLDPTYAGCFGDDGYVHDAQCVVYKGPHQRYQNREICFSFNEDSFTLVDVTDKNNMVMISKTGYVNVAYTHQGWATDDHTLVLLDDELDENGKPTDQQFTKTYVWDVTDLTLPTLKTVYQSSERSIDHNQYIRGNLVYQSNYESGLRILRLDQANYGLTQVGYFDVFPSRTTANFNGAWSVYPYFPSGNIVINSIDYGMFVVRAHPMADNVTAERFRTRELIHHGSFASCPALEERQACIAEVYC